MLGYSLKIRFRHICKERLCKYYCLFFYEKKYSAKEYGKYAFNTNIINNTYTIKIDSINIYIYIYIHKVLIYKLVNVFFFKFKQK